MTHSTPDPTFRLATITPAIARKWLEYNLNNRRISALTVNRYASDMAAGLWQFTADPIRFDDRGALIDGQHRLAAIAAQQDGFEIQLLVVTKLATSAQMVMDQGKTRTSGDQLALVGIRDTNVVAAGIRLHLTHQEGLLFRDNKVASKAVTKARIAEWAIANQGLVESASSVPNFRGSDATPSVAYCFALMSITQRDWDWTAEFFRLLHVGAGEGHPINALDKRLQRARRERVKTPPREMLAWFLMAANAWTEGKRLTKLQAPRGGRWTSETFPVLVGSAA